MAVLKTLPSDSVHCCVTSPPYWGLRDYRVEGQIGLETDVDQYVAKLVGVDYVGLGSDFDGISAPPKDMDDVTHLPAITRELQKRGYSDDDIRKILGGNFMRVFAAACR